MFIKVKFKPKENTDGAPIKIPFNNQKELNSFVYRTLGDNNPYHDKFSEYSISSIQGGKMDPDNHSMLIFNEAPYIVVASEDQTFLGALITGLAQNKYSFFDLVYDKIEIGEFPLNKRFDTIMTISPVIVKDENQRKISIDNPEFLNRLKLNCMQKLAHKGIEDSTFDIFLRHPEKAKKKLIMVGDTFNICTHISLYVYGKVETRKALYSMGLGGSTGSGFGAIKVYC